MRKIEEDYPEIEESRLRRSAAGTDLERSAYRSSGAGMRDAERSAHRSGITGGRDAGNSARRTGGTGGRDAEDSVRRSGGTDGGEEELTGEELARRKQKKKKAVIREILSNSLFILIVLAITLLIVKYVGQRTVVDGQSMEPALSNSDNLIVDKISYRFKDPERFDIIVFPPVYGEKTYYIKRIIALPGETVRIDEDGNIYINGEILEENYGKETIQEPGLAYEEIQLGEDEYFVLGDNRNHSSDSRTPAVGLVHRKDIIGKAFIRIYPFSKFGLL